jgi:ABC-type nitrate/sulfonate/bicarbonate transport system permease component
VALLVALWETNSRVDLYRIIAPTLPDAFFPTALEIASAVASSLASAAYQEALVLTLSRTLAAFFIASVAGVITALLAARMPALENLLYLPVEFFRQLPAVAVIPFAIIAFGIYSEMKISVAVFGCFFPVYVSARDGLMNVDATLMRTARAYGWNGSRLLLGVMLPSATPHILSVLRIVLSISLILVIISEMLVGGDGLGVRIVDRERTFDFPGLYAETLLLGAVGTILSFGLLAASHRIHYWRDDSSWAQAAATTRRAGD